MGSIVDTEALVISSTAIWTPILPERLAIQASDAVTAIAGDLRAEPVDWHPNPGLPGGAAGLALFFGYLYQERGENRCEDAAIRYAEQAARLTPVVANLPALHGGFSGVAWVIEHLQERLFETGNSDPNEEVDRILLHLLAEPAEDGPVRDAFDLMSGLVGIGVYALERLPRPGARECLNLILDRLDCLSERTDCGITWRTSSDGLPADRRAINPDGYYNLGMAHGIPGVIAFLAKCYVAGISCQKVERMLAGAIDWLVAQKLPAGFDSVFPTGVATGVEPHSAGLAWCHGDPGIATALIGAGLQTGHDSWLEEGLSVARMAAVRSPAESGVVDAALCHGACGLAHLFNRMYQSTGDAVLEQAALDWFEQALRQRRSAAGIGGYLGYTPGSDGRLDWRAEPGFLNGAAGIGLALLGGISNLEPAWDRCLLAALPVRSS